MQTFFVDSLALILHTHKGDFREGDLNYSSSGGTICAQRYGYPHTEKMCLSLWILFLLVLNKSGSCYATKGNFGRNVRAVGHSEEYIKQVQMI
ncbi:unnamed protein product [Onchocerca flexuosa]|uniref:Secreted protein n=1 Tax=Onchocerca flexuosa TaxID=387005 RepID=A0A183HP39_9BILA|nr:unnamed protein product [Onchocerca flexuosa]